jgi:hypothetical protein
MKGPTTREGIAAVQRMMDTRVRREPDGEGIIALGVRREGSNVAGYFLQNFRKGRRGRG